MTGPVAEIREVGNSTCKPAYKWVMTWCPACKTLHPFTIEVYDGSDNPTWEWDGNLESPTFSPSMLCYSTVHICEGQHTYTACDLNFNECGHKGHGYFWDMPDGSQKTFKVYDYDKIPEGALRHTFSEMSPHADPAYGNCHSFLKAGVWEFLSDCAHDMAGKSVPMVPLPDWYEKE